MPRPNTDIRQDDLPSAVTYASQSALQRANTCLPGVVIAFNAETKRAEVIPAIDRLIVSGNEEMHIPHPVILDVPIVYPKGGGYAVTFPLAKNDDVVIVFSQRGLTDFKAKLAEADTVASGSRPDRGVFFRIADAIAIPGIASGDDTVYADSMNISIPSGGGLTINGKPAFDPIGPVITSAPLATGTTLTNLADGAEVTTGAYAFDTDFPTALRTGIQLGRAHINIAQGYVFPAGAQGILAVLRDDDDNIIGPVSSFPFNAIAHANLGNSSQTSGFDFRMNATGVVSTTRSAFTGAHGIFVARQVWFSNSANILYITLKMPSMSIPANTVRNLQWCLWMNGGAGIPL